MTDIATQFCDAFTTVFECLPKQLYCTWHVDKAWQEQLRSKIGDKEIEAQTYLGLRIVLEQTDEDLFKKYLEILRKRLHSSPATRAFAEYFDRQWVPHITRWGYFARVGLGINTNMFCEAFHRVFKYKYLKGKQNRRVDKCLISLRKYIKDKLFERMIKKTKDKMTQRIRMIRARHQSSLYLDVNAVSPDASKDDTWQVKSDTGATTYQVSYLKEKCDEGQCALDCPDCKVCIHSYGCTCTDYQLYFTICKHIHLVHRHRLLKNEIIADIVDESYTPQDDEMQADETDELFKMVTNEKCNHLASLKQEGEALFHSLIGSIQESDERHINALRDVIRSGKAIKSTFETMKQVRKVTKMEPVFKATNKNIDTQRRFFSTTKRRKKGNIRHAKQTDKDREDFVNSIDVEDKKQHQGI